MDRRVDITDVNVPKTVSFSYSVEWVEDDLPWKNRMSRYADSRFLPGSFEIHWLSIINSFVLVLLLTAFLTIILLRVLKNDFSRYMELDDDALEEEEVCSHFLLCCVDPIEWYFLMVKSLTCFQTLSKLVGMETDSWWRLPLSGTCDDLLFCSGCRKPIDCLDTLSFVLGAH